MNTTMLEFFAFFGFRWATVAADSRYKELHRSFETDGSLLIELSNPNGSKRSIAFGQAANQRLRFQGTTFRDLKWLTEYNDLRELVLHRGKTGGGVLELVWKGGDSKRLGWIADEGWDQLQEVTRASVTSRALAA